MRERFCVEEGMVDLRLRMAMESSVGMEAEAMRMRLPSARTLKRDDLMVPGESGRSCSASASGVPTECF